MTGQLIDDTPIELDAGGIRHEALRRAETVTSAWANLTVTERCRYVGRLREAIVKRQLGIIETVASETGKPVTEIASQEVTAALEMLAFMEGAYPRWLRPRKFHYWRPGFWTKRSAVHFEPIGVFLIIGPATYPFSLPIMQACAALLCGNACVLKPSEKVPRLTKLFREIIAEAGLPAGVIEIVEGAGEVVEELIAHETVRKVICTGSYETGRRVAELCGRHFKPCVLELGGSGAAIVCDDANLKLAARGIAWSAYYANGLSCIGTKRVFVHRHVAEDFAEELQREVGKIRSGDPLNPTMDVGREVSGPAILFDLSSQSPAISLKTGNHSFQNNGLKEPLLVREVSSDEEAINEANASEFGLGASIWSSDINRARSLARQLEAGMVWINDSSAGQPQFPWGGLKHSGWGRLFSREAIAELTNLKVISHDRRLTARAKLWWFPYTPEKFDLFLAVNELIYGANKKKALRKTAVAFWQFLSRLKGQYER